jgi:DNA-binding NarL/FixJ family response regulator
LLVDDEPIFRQGLRILLGFGNTDGAPRIEIVGEATTVEQAIALSQQQHPALILLDLELIKGNGINVLRQLRQMTYKGKVLVLSAHQEDEWIFKAMQAGADGYVFKSRVANQIYEAIATVNQGEIYLPKEAASGFFRLFQTSAESYFQARQQLHLTERELEVLQWLVQGAGNDEIAKKLDLLGNSDQNRWNAYTE